ncbi:MAG: hypothetical protein A2Z99_05270 [Treponema sp. GWB1_62_6]|nr:MAG: hypothetical protein A2Y36_14395 [Treponema sp. GWA1_62_8]OHE68306.1 MAG: hypothetical protein A2413_09690 [Treponema sp. RIFOXYC1_FULL_61_9]OHE69354.1 MAG: hypothetical protein A2001_12730 [Treponema sp. GWC1_61_84]OHE70757.1 MAG: hypothetical protein A2Z99_05270 [Treponema sp. GWB1_62_6]
MDIAISISGVLMIAAAIGAVLTRSLLVSIILSGGVSLIASLVFLLMGAPDVAMTEAAIGSGLTTIVFLYAMARSKQTDDEDADERMEITSEGSGGAS